MKSHGKFPISCRALSDIIETDWMESDAHFVDQYRPGFDREIYQDGNAWRLESNSVYEQVITHQDRPIRERNHLKFDHVQFGRICKPFPLLPLTL
jgi:hypothetical protein